MWGSDGDQTCALSLASPHLRNGAQQWICPLMAALPHVWSISVNILLWLSPTPDNGQSLFLGAWMVLSAAIPQICMGGSFFSASPMGKVRLVGWVWDTYVPCDC